MCVRVFVCVCVCVHTCVRACVHARVRAYVVSTTYFRQRLCTRFRLIR